MKTVLAIALLSFTFATDAIAAPLPEQPPAPSYTDAQAKAGQDEYVTHCIDCHGKNLNDGEFGGPPLIGPGFKERWLGQPPSALLGFVAAAMPPEAPGRLPIETYAEIVAYILRANGVPAGDRALTAESAPPAQK